MYPHSLTASGWSRQDDKAFEEALVMFPEELSDRWQRIAEQVGKSVREVEEHYEALEHDVYEIDSGRVELPCYVDQCFLDCGKSKDSGDGERKKGTPWTQEEHKKFLEGLSKYGKGDWRSISRHVVVTRTPTQVASHAQKYFLRQNSAVKKERKRSSIHDITTVDNNVCLPVDQSWIPQPGEPVQQSQTMQTLLPSGHFLVKKG